MASEGAAPPVITFLSDYGHADEFVGVCHGVITRRCPTARVIDLTHVVPPHDVRAGAILLRSALPYLPSGVHLAVVDPGVSAVGPHGRRAVALRTAEQDRLLVGPDNGLLMAAAERLGGVIEAVDIGESPERLLPVSRTFHGRDIFAPVAAALAAGETLAAVGEPLAVESLRRMGIPQAHLSDGVLTAHVLRTDTFGNLILNAANEQLLELGAELGDVLRIRHEGSPHSAAYAETFADVTPGELLIYEDSQQMVSLAVNRGSAARLLGAEQDDELHIRMT
ncbi:MAG TPA: SAM-dependent chlorinase/fluorinase [Solirubrobacteraceae bacterium]|nr:SAM-dependent chlorinase/fluorinase [Solirubrobacteraceae bacterium]